MKRIINILILLTLCVNIACAGETICSGSSVSLYNELEDKVYMSAVNDNETNYNKTVCFNCTCIEGEISIAGSNEYELEYSFTADINDSIYISRILIISQSIHSSGLLTGKTLNRTLILDGITIGEYQTKCGWFGKIKRNTVYFDLIDNNIRFGMDVIINESLAFTQLNYINQQNYLYNVTDTCPRFPIYHKYITVGLESDSSLQLTGLTGIFYNVFGDTILTKIPLVGSGIASFGKSIQALIYLPLTLIQFTFNIIFTFIILISNNWWYALLLLEIMCIIPSLKYKTYPDVMSSYVSFHIAIFKFVYENIFLNIINLILRLIEIIRNMFRI